jgi:hypothetical protein
MNPKTDAWEIRKLIKGTKPGYPFRAEGLNAHKAGTRDHAFRWDLPDIETDAYILHEDAHVDLAAAKELVRTHSRHASHRRVLDALKGHACACCGRVYVEARTREVEEIV